MQRNQTFASFRFELRRGLKRESWRRLSELARARSGGEGPETARDVTREPTVGTRKRRLWCTWEGKPPASAGLLPGAGCDAWAGRALRE